MSVRGAWRSRRRVLVLAAATRVVSGQAVARAARPLRPRRHRAAAARGRARRRAVRSVGGRALSASTAARDLLEAHAPERVPEAEALLAPRGRAAAAVGPRPSPRRTGRAHRRCARRLGDRAAGARRRGAWHTARRASWSPRERARPRRVRCRDGRASGQRAEGRSLPALPRTLRRRGIPPAPRGRGHPLGRPLRPRVPGVAAGDLRPTARSLPAWGGRRRPARPAVGRDRRRPRVLGIRARTSPAPSAASSRRAGLVVVSGLARGVDGEAHRGALEAGGPTVAVLGCGIDRDYPAAHAELARRIAARGPGRLRVRARRRAGTLAVPGRNRIVAGSRARQRSSSRRVSGAVP